MEGNSFRLERYYTSILLWKKSSLLNSKTTHGMSSFFNTSNRREFRMFFSFGRGWGALPTMAYTGRLRLKGVLFSGFTF